MASFLVNVSSKRLQRSLIFMQTSQFVTARFGDRTLDSQVTNAAGASTKKISSEVQDRIKGAYFGALIGDALCLGSHYEYDAPTIKQAYGGQPLQTFMAPGEKMGGTTHGVGWGRMNYHPGQKAGDQTDYGLYNVFALSYLSGETHGPAGTKKRDATSTAPIDKANLVAQWQHRLTAEKWGAWKCTQTKQTLQQVQMGVSVDDIGGMSNAMAIRSAPVLGVYASEDDAAKASDALMFTHRSAEALVGGRFFTRVAHKVAFKKMTPRAAIDEACAQMSEDAETGAFVKDQCRKGIAKFNEATDKTKALSKEEFVDDLAMTSMARLWEVGKSEPIKVGKASPTEGTMPSSIYMILKYAENFEEGVKANAMVGGDNASRSIAIGMVLGAYQGAKKMPSDLVAKLHATEDANRQLQKLPLLRD